MRHVFHLLIIGMLSQAMSGCGVFTFFIEGPKAMARNDQRIAFSVDIVDEAGNPLADVKVTPIPWAESVDLFFPDGVSLSKPESSRTIDQTFTYATYGNYWVVVDYEKPLYQSVRMTYSREGDRVLVPHGQLVTSSQWMECIDVTVYPHSRVVMKRLVATSGQNVNPSERNGG
jgi:hypothetical protein